jgi:hypothetical protein
MNLGADLAKGIGKVEVKIVFIIHVREYAF